MIKVILIFSLCSQTISSWDLNHPLIVNKNGNKVFFPLYVEEENTENYTSDNESIILYKEPNDTTTQTYAFCNDASDLSALKGTLLEGNTKIKCPHTGLGISRAMFATVANGEKIRCGTKENTNSGYHRYIMYSKLKIDKTEYTLYLYNYCYDETTAKSTLYASYDLDNPRLLGNLHLADEQRYNFSMLQLINPLTNAPLDGNEEATIALYEKQKEYKACQVGIPAFAPFGYWIISFYQWHNIAPMNEHLVSIWADFVDDIRWRIAETSEPLKIYSGVYDVLKVNDSIQYLADSQIPIPLFWWILLYNKDKTQGVSLIMHNYSYGLEEKKHNPLCEQSVCGNVGLQEDIPRGEESRKAFIYCCPASAIAEKFGFHQANELLKFIDENSVSTRIRTIFSE